MHKIKYFIALGLGFVAFESIAFSETVQCSNPEKTTTLTIVKKGYSGSYSAPMLVATLKASSIRGSYEFTVKRRKKSKNIFYQDHLYRKTFELKIASETVSGSNLLAELTLDRGTAFQSNFPDLECSITGEPFPPLVACPDEPNAAFINAAKYGSVEHLEALLECGADVNFRDSSGCTALLYVSDLACGYWSQPEGHPADPRSAEAPRLSSRSALILNDLVQTLVEYGAALETKDPTNDETTLLKLTKYGQISALDLLMEAKPNMNAQDRAGNTSVMNAAFRRNDLLLRTLLHGKPDLRLKNKLGQTAYDIAELKGYEELFELLKPVEASAILEGRGDGSCTPTMVHLEKDKPVEIILKASSTAMFLLEAPDLGLELMAMSGGTAHKTITPARSGTFPFTCGVHGSSTPTRGSFMVM